MKEFNEELKFIKEHQEEIIPVTQEKELVLKIGQQENPRKPLELDQKRVETILENFETKLFVYDKEESLLEPQAKRVMLSASETLAGNIMRPIINEMKQDQRCRGIIFLTDNKTGEQFVKDRDTDFKQAREEKLLLVDALRIVEEKPIDAALVAVEPGNSPSAEVLFGGKSVFGAKKLYFLVSGWLGFGSGGGIFEPDRYKNMDEIDGFFVADELAKKILQHQLPEYPANRIMITGTPVVDSLELHKADEYEKLGKEKLGLNEEETSILYLGDTSADAGEGINKRFNEETFQRSLAAIIKTAEIAPERKFVLLVRPHPRDANKNELFKVPDNLPVNLRIIPATSESVSMQEAAYASDIIMSICSTENVLAKFRGKKGIYLGYEKGNLGGKILENLFGRDLMKVFNEQENLAIVSSPDDLAAYLKEYRRPGKLPVAKNLKQENSVQKIVDIILSGENE